jgi:hypothetical protein
MGASKPMREKLWQNLTGKLPAVGPITSDLIPYIEGFTVFDVGSQEPFIVIRWVAEPANEELPAAATAARVNNFVNDMFFQSIRGEDWARL